VLLSLAATADGADGDGDGDDEDSSILVVGRATAVPPVHVQAAAPRPGVARATIVGAAPMSAQSFTVWAQRALLGTANPLIGDVLGWALPHQVTELDLPGDARASHHARSAMRSLSGDLSCADDVLLATSELTANALQHGGGAPRLTAIVGEHSVTVALTDRRPEALPVVQPLRGPVAVSGRGMAIVDEIADHWGVTVYHDHKVVWCELHADPPERGGGPQA
jgi:anti-sigma regulatory factor (Ser/Thr protein kinase)